jgi:hypothetical protein
MKLNTDTNTAISFTSKSDNINFNCNLYNKLKVARIQCVKELEILQTVDFTLTIMLIIFFQEG